MDPLRIGVLGLGQRGLQHLAVLWRLQEEGLVRVSALVDLFPENLAVEKLARFVPGFRPEGIHRTSDYREVLDREEVEALVVALPPGFHRGEVVAAARAGVHLFVEKPMSLYLDQALEMLHAIESTGVIATVGFQHRYDPRNEAVHRFLSTRRVVMITMVQHAPLEAHSVKHTPTDRLGGPPNRVWTASRAWSGTTVVEAGIHQVDLMRYWAGEIEWVEATYVHRRPEEILDGADNPHAYRVTLGFRSGAVGNLLMTRIRGAFYSESYTSIQWIQGHLCWESGWPVAYTYRGSYPPSCPPRLEQLRHPLPLPVRHGATEAIHRAFLRAVSRRDLGAIRSPFADGIFSLAAVLAANASDARGGERIPLEAFLSSDRYALDRRPPRTS